MSTTSTSTSNTPSPHPGDVGFVLLSTALVQLMIPGLGYFYSGMARDKNALSLMLISIVSLAVVLIQWFIIGYSLSFSTTSGPFLGNGQFAFLMGVHGDTTVIASLPNIAYCIFQAMFASITPALVVGSIAERFNMIPMCIFMVIWTTLVYDPIAYWTWGANGWLLQLGALDFAGGTPVHMASGFAGLALALYCGKRRLSDEPIKPHSMSSVILGTALLWFGWNGFNGGSAGAANARAAMAIVTTNLAASMAGLTWLVIDYVRDRRVSALGFCSGVVSGLVVITPGCGYVSPASSLAFGFLGAFVCNYASRLKHKLRFDDTLDVFGIHGVGGTLGNFLTGIFAERWVIALDGTDKPGGALSGNGMQIVYQLASIGAGISWAFFVTLAIVFVMDKVGLSLRASEEHEDLGVDHSQMGEYTFDYVGERISTSIDVKRSTASHNASASVTSPSLVIPDP